MPTKKTPEKKSSVKKASVKKTPEKKTSIKKSSERKTPTKNTGDKKKSGFKTCPYCGNEIKAAAIKCQYCDEFLDNPKRSTSKKTTRKSKELQIQDLPDKWDLLTERQKEVLIKNFPLKGWYKVAVFFFTGIFLLYARRYGYFFLYLLACCIPFGGLIATIIICVNWESICYNEDSINMKRTLMQYKKQWDKEDPDYDNSEIYGHVGGAWILLLLIPGAIFVIGILIAALMPRMQSAQGRARDVARKTALSQIQSAIVTYQSDYGKWPGMDRAKNGISVSEIKSELMSAGMTSIPVDPLRNSKFAGLGSYQGNADGDYAYMVSKRNGIDNGGFVLMAKMEVPGGSNWIVCDNGEGKINPGADLMDIKICDTVEQGNSCSNSKGNCTYSSESELRYIVVY